MPEAWSGGAQYLIWVAWPMNAPLFFSAGLDFVSLAPVSAQVRAYKSDASEAEQKAKPPKNASQRVTESRSTFCI